MIATPPIIAHRRCENVRLGFLFRGFNLIFVGRLSTAKTMKIGSLEIFRLYRNKYMYTQQY